MVKKVKKASEKGYCKNWNERVKRLSYHDIKHIKLSSIAFAFFLVSIWEGLRLWIGRTHWAWFLALAILFSVKPLASFWGKK